MFATRLCGLLMALLLAAPISANLSAISLTRTTDNLDLAFAWKVMEAHTLSSRVLCASMCERKAWCVAVALCQQSSTPLVACGLVTVNVTLNVMHSDDLSHCRVHYSKKRLEVIFLILHVLPLFYVCNRHYLMLEGYWKSLEVTFHIFKYYHCFMSSIIIYYRSLWQGRLE